MNSLKIEISNLPGIQKQLANAVKGIETQIEAEMKAFSKATVEDAIRLAPTDEGHLRSSISYILTKEGNRIDVEIVVATNYAAYLEFGTRKFAAAYVSSLPPDWQSFAAQFKGGGNGSLEEMLLRLKEWVMRKGFAAELTKSGNKSKSKSSIKAQENAAYEIAIQILLNGIKAHPFLYPAVTKNKALLIENLNSLLAA